MRVSVRGEVLESTARARGIQPDASTRMRARPHGLQRAPSVEARRRDSVAVRPWWRSSASMRGSRPRKALKLSERAAAAAGFEHVLADSAGRSRRRARRRVGALPRTRSRRRPTAPRPTCSCSSRPHSRRRRCARSMLMQRLNGGGVHHRDLGAHRIDDLPGPAPALPGSACRRMSISANSTWRSVCRPLWKFFAASMRSNSARGSGSPRVDVRGQALDDVPLPAEVLHELARQLDRVPFDAGDAGDAEVVDLRQHAAAGRGRTRGRAS